MRYILAIATVAIAVAGSAAGAPRYPVFEAPGHYVGRSVMVCGYMPDSTNMLDSRLRRAWNRRGGLTVLDGSPLPPRFRGSVCVEGEISALCGREAAICSETAFDFAIRIRRVLSAQPFPRQ